MLARPVSSHSIGTAPAPDQPSFSGTGSGTSIAEGNASLIEALTLYISLPEEEQHNVVFPTVQGKESPEARLAHSVTFYHSHKRAVHSVVSSFATQSPNGGTTRKTVKQDDVQRFRGVLILLWSQVIPTSAVIPELTSIAGSYLAAKKLDRFLTFLKHHHRIVRAVLADVYDDESYRETLSSSLSGRLESLAPFVTKLQLYIARGKQTKPSSAKPTQPNPPVLTRPRTPRVPTPQPVPNQPKARPIPDSHYVRKTKEQLANEKRERERRRMMQQHAKQRAKNTATVKATTPSEVAPDVTHHGALLTTASLPHKLGHIPARTSSPYFSGGATGPKLTATTIMRETALHKKREAAADRALAHALMGLVDPDHVREAEAEARRAAQDAREAELRRLRLSVQLAKEEAGIQREVAVKEKQIVAQQVKSDMETRLADLERAQRELDAANRARVAQVQDLTDRVAEAKARVAEEKQRLARESAAEAERQREEAAQRAERELEERRELIRQIRALEAATVALVGVSGRQALNGANVVDLTSSSNVGLLTEMSVVELQERLIQAKAVAKAAEDKRREEIAREKADKNAQLQKSLEYVQQARARVSAANSRGSGASTSGSTNGLRTVSSILGQATSKLQALSEVEEMERKLADKRKEKLKLIATNSASPHRYRVRIKHVEKPVSRPPTPPISISLPNLSVHGGLADSTWNKVDLRKHVPLLKLRKVDKYPSAPELTTVEGADDDLDEDGKPREPKKLEGKRLTDAIAAVLGLDKVVG